MSDIKPSDVGSPPSRRHGAREHVDQSRFSCPVLSEKPKALAFVDNQAHVLDCHLVPKLFRQVLNDELVLIRGADRSTSFLFEHVLVNRVLLGSAMAVRKLGLRQNLNHGVDRSDLSTPALPPTPREEEQPIARGLVRLWQNLVKIKANEAIKNEVQVHETYARFQLPVPPRAESRDAMAFHGAAPIHEVHAPDHCKLGREVQRSRHPWHFRPSWVVPVHSLRKHDAKSGSKKDHAVSHDGRDP
mmetsp:Transcript_9300/g.26443  ORF Transcript_9300/g.26443 Transcript_9300/m.26443 type:complete len:244 (-) Transcript_9300:1266-1997(-)